ncbi:hypothetical protein D3C77_677100 [compost metagenome]
MAELNHRSIGRLRAGTAECHRLRNRLGDTCNVCKVEPKLPGVLGYPLIDLSRSVERLPGVLRNVIHRLLSIGQLLSAFGHQAQAVS